jgi:hypothetical protein
MTPYDFGQWLSPASHRHVLHTNVSHDEIASKTGEEGVLVSIKDEIQYVQSYDSSCL